MDKYKEYLGGRITNTRLLTSRLISQLKSEHAKVYPATFKKQNQVYCRRCFSKIYLTDFAGVQPYCRNCLNFGKILLDDQLLITDGEIDWHPVAEPMTWDGHLTTLQTKVCHEVLQSYHSSHDHLIWAVTGAGKTEIIFPLINEIIKNNQRVAICSPRIDVCLELYPRVQQAFKNVTIGIFHGKNDIKYSPTQIMIGTVHQLVRFEKAFDVLIIDEVDSYPLIGDKMLHRAIQKSKKDQGSIVYLSATPPVTLLEQVKNGDVNLSKLHQRFHGYPLPEPKCHLLFKSTFFWQVNPRIKWLVQKILKRRERMMIFFPRIELMIKFEKIFKGKFPQTKVVSVSSKDEKRIEKVQEFREEQAEIILTTTILERGVTFHHVHVIVLDADASEFSKTALVQIAGRAGRDKNHPDDEVHFFYQFFTEKILQACTEIQSINQEAFRK